MIVTIPTDKAKYFRQGLQILRHMPPLNKLANRELDVLAWLLYYDHQYKDIEELLRQKLVFDYEIRVIIRDKLEISEDAFNNLIVLLKKKGIVKGKQLVSRFGLNPDSPDITFKFKMTDDKKD